MVNQIITIVVLLFFSMFFSASETAFSSANKIKLKNMADNDNEKASLVLKLNERYDRLITTILVGNNIANIAMTAVVTVLCVELWGAKLGSTIATVATTLVILIVGEISPKILAREYATDLSIFLAPALKFVMIILTPITTVFNGLKLILQKLFGSNEDKGFSEDELLTIVEEAEAGGAIGIEQSELITNAIEFNDVEAIDVLTPRVDIIALERGIPIAEIKKIFRESGLSRLPVYEDDLDHIIGVLNLKDFYNNNLKTIRAVDEYIKPVAYVAESIKASVLLRKMQLKKTHIAIVVDEYGGTTGLVTLEDIIEEIVGDIYDEHDTAVLLDVRPAGKGGYLVSGGANLEDFFDMFDEKIDIEATTVNGWVMIELNRLPKQGDEFTYNAKNHVFNVRVNKVDGRKALMVKVNVDKIEDDEN